MKLTVTAKQRDALHDQILDRLSGIGDIELAIRSKDYETAERLGREYVDDLRLLDALGFGEGSGEPVDLAASPEVLSRALPRLRVLAERHTVSLESEWAEAEEIRSRNRLVEEACEAVLAKLGDAEPGIAQRS